MQWGGYNGRCWGLRVWGKGCSLIGSEVLMKGTLGCLGSVGPVCDLGRVGASVVIEVKGGGVQAGRECGRVPAAHDGPGVRSERRKGHRI